MTITHPEISRTCEARAAAEVHGLHAFGEYDLVDSTCGREGDEREKEKVRNEEACAAGRAFICSYIPQHSGSYEIPGNALGLNSTC